MKNDEILNAQRRLNMLNVNTSPLKRARSTTITNIHRFTLSLEMLASSPRNIKMC